MCGDFGCGGVGVTVSGVVVSPCCGVMCGGVVVIRCGVRCGCQMSGVVVSR